MNLKKCSLYNNLQNCTKQRKLSGPNPPPDGRNSDDVLVPSQACSQHSGSLGSFLSACVFPPPFLPLRECPAPNAHTVGPQQAFTEWRGEAGCAWQTCVCFLLNNRTPPGCFQRPPGMFQNVVVFIGICRFENSWGCVFNVFILSQFHTYRMSFDRISHSPLLSSSPSLKLLPHRPPSYFHILGGHCI